MTADTVVATFDSKLSSEGDRRGRGHGPAIIYPGSEEGWPSSDLAGVGGHRWRGGLQPWLAPRRRNPRWWLLGCQRRRQRPRSAGRPTSVGDADRIRHRGSTHHSLRALRAAPRPRPAGPGDCARRVAPGRVPHGTRQSVRRVLPPRLPGGRPGLLHGCRRELVARRHPRGHGRGDRPRDDRRPVRPRAPHASDTRLA
jgi:hypothetical protein